MPLLHDVAHLSHTELLTPEPEKSLAFFTEVLGLTQNGAGENSVYLRTWDDYEHHSMKLTASAASGIGELRPALKNQAQAYPGRGVSVRRLDHVNYLAAETAPNGRFVCSVLGARVTEQMGGCTTSPLPPTPERTCCGPRTFASIKGCSSRPGRTSTLSSRPSFCTSTSQEGTVSSCATPARD